VPKPRKTALKDLSTRLGHDFSDPALLKLALTHASARTGMKSIQNNEQLEFLGDRVLGLAIADLLVQLNPGSREGELAPWFNNLVRAETCIEVARTWGLDDLIQTSNSNIRGDRILGDACEAVLGAIFVDGGYEAARKVVKAFWEPYLSERQFAGPNPKSDLQEWAQARGLPLPHYLEVGREGPDHAPRFTAEVQIEGVAPERGQGANKRAAEQAAALAMLVREGVWRAPHNG
jgi:ribonuclease-3